jgi:hypothetical protein
MEHLLLPNVYNRELWFKLLRSSGWNHLAPSYVSTFPDWWLLTRKRLHKELHHGFDMFAILVSSVSSAVSQGPRNSPKLRCLPAASFCVVSALGSVLDICKATTSQHVEKWLLRAMLTKIRNHGAPPTVLCIQPRALVQDSPVVRLASLSSEL